MTALVSTDFPDPLWTPKALFPSPASPLLSAVEHVFILKHTSPRPPRPPTPLCGWSSFIYASTPPVPPIVFQGRGVWSFGASMHCSSAQVVLLWVWPSLRKLFRSLAWPVGESGACKVCSRLRQMEDTEVKKMHCHAGADCINQREQNLICCLSCISLTLAFSHPRTNTCRACVCARVCG